jgi:mRNA interferase MazF
VRRGDLVTVAVAVDFGKPRPALVVQSDRFQETDTITVLLVSATLVDAPLIRPSVQPRAENGLRQPSQVMIDKPMTVRREKLGPIFGHLEDETMASVTRLLALFLGLAS